MDELIKNVDEGLYRYRTINGHEIAIRYPSHLDLEAMWQYINALSQERTYIHFQGEDIPLEMEKKYLDTQLEKIAKHETVMLLAFSGNDLIGLAEVEMKDRAERHIGVLGVSIAKPFRGEGLGSLLMELIINEAVSKLPFLEILTLCVFSSNATGKALYKKFGFAEYGCLPQGLKLESEYVDHVLMYKSVK